jgi:hypothetical protein
VKREAKYTARKMAAKKIQVARVEGACWGRIWVLSWFVMVGKAVATRIAVDSDQWSVVSEQ